MAICKKRNPFRGLTTISDKGQIVIPVDLRDELNLTRGQKLIILKRQDNQGFTCLKENVISDTLNKLAQKGGD